MVHSQVYACGWDWIELEGQSIVGKALDTVVLVGSTPRKGGWSVGSGKKGGLLLIFSSALFIYLFLFWCCSKFPCVDQFVDGLLNQGKYKDISECTI
jgi:hypothetical protein